MRIRENKVMRKVLFVIETLRGGGAERAVSNIVTHFPKDCEIDILVNDESLVEYPYRGNILSLSRPEKKSLIYFIRNIIKRIIFLKKLKKINKYDACISFLDSANISNILSGKRYCRTIVSVRIDMMTKKNRWYEKIFSLFLTKYLYKHADQIVAVSKEIEWKLVNWLGISSSRVRTIINGCDCKWIEKKMILHNQDMTEDFVTRIENRKLIVTIGRLVDQKGQWHLIRAFSEVIKKEPQAVLLILGMGPLKDYLAKLLVDYGLEESVFLIGYSENPYWYLGKADVFILPSLYEGYPNALMEAVCCGVPCIATDVHSGTREILAPTLKIEGKRVVDIILAEYGVLIPVCSGKKHNREVILEIEEQKMADAVLMLLNDERKKEYYRDKSKERSRDLDINHVVNKWIDVIEDRVVC